MSNTITMEQKNKILPELRFPEFVKDGEWKEDEIRKLFKFKQGIQVPVENQYNNSTKSRVRFIRIIDITNSFEPKRYIENPGNEYLIKKEDLFMIRYGSPGVISIGYEGVIANNLFRLIWNLNKEFKYIYWFYTFQKIEKSIYNLSGSSSMPAISFTTLDDFKIIYTENAKEQQKIADCLSSLDQVIAAYTDKLKVLKNYKKGLLQNLFPQEGQKVPHYRFPEFVSDGEWIFEQFNKVYSFFVTNSYSRDKLNYGNGQVKNIHYGDIHTKFSTLFDITKENVPYINSDISITKIREECYCKEGDLIFADASEDLNDIGKSIEIINLNDEKLVSGLHTLLARQFEQKIAIGFAGYLFLTNEIRKQIKKESQGAKVLGISGTRLSNIEIYYPKDFEEQKKIADCLIEIDNLIALQTEKIEQLKLHKKGLMQGLFPKID